MLEAASETSATIFEWWRKVFFHILELEAEQVAYSIYTQVAGPVPKAYFMGVYRA